MNAPVAIATDLHLLCFNEALVSSVNQYCREHPFFAQDHAVDISRMFVELGLPALDSEVFV